MPLNNQAQQNKEGNGITPDRNRQSTAPHYHTNIFYRSSRVQRLVTKNNLPEKASGRKELKNSTEFLWSILED